MWLVTKTLYPSESKSLFTSGLNTCSFFVPAYMPSSCPDDGSWGLRGEKEFNIDSTVGESSLISKSCCCYVTMLSCMFWPWECAGVEWSLENIFLSAKKNLVKHKSHAWHTGDQIKPVDAAHHKPRTLLSIRAPPTAIIASIFCSSGKWRLSGTPWSLMAEENLLKSNYFFFF